MDGRQILSLIKTAQYDHLDRKRDIANSKLTAAASAEAENLATAMWYTDIMTIEAQVIADAIIEGFQSVLANAITTITEAIDETEPATEKANDEVHAS